MLVSEFGGSVADWQRMKNKEVQFWLEAAVCIIRKRALAQETSAQRMRR